MSELAASSADIIELIARLTRRGYRVSFKPRTVNFMPAMTILIELAEEFADELSPNGYLRKLSPFPQSLTPGVPLMLHPYGENGVLKELERAANLLAPEAH